MARPDERERSDDRSRSNLEILARLWPRVREKARTFAGAGVLLCVVVAANLGGPQILRRVVNVAVDGGAVEHVLWLAGLFVAVIGAGILVELVLTLVVTRVGLEIVTKLKEDVFRHVLNLPVGYFLEHPPGKILSRVESDAERLRRIFDHVTVRLAHGILLFCGIIVLMAVEDPWSTLAVLVFVPVLGGVAVLFVRRVKEYYRASRRAHAEVVEACTEHVQAVDLIQHYGYEPVANDRLAERNARKVRVNAIAYFLEHGFWGIFGLLEVLATAAVLAVGARKIVAGTMDIGTLVLFIEYLRRVFEPILALGEFMTFVQQALVAGGRVLGILEREPAPGARIEGGGEPEPAALEAAAFTDAVRFESVSFAYEDGADVVREVSFAIGRGETVALVGPSGGGKSTLASLLLRFHDPRVGRIAVDGRDLREIPRHAWRARTGLVLQGVHLFPGTLRENLTVFRPEVPDEAILEALEVVRARDVVERLDGGLDAVLAERGANLSRGEQQLLSFARAIVGDPPLLVLDEATASVDPVTERRVQESLDRVLEGRTSLVIAHRLSTIRGADRIVGLVEGRVVEQGTHDELRARDGLYSRLLALQHGEVTAG